MRSILKSIFFVSVICGSATAQENENAVALSLGLEASSSTLEKISLKIEGRQVTVSTQLKNTTDYPQIIGWYASTPQFSILGTGEEHLDKSFADVRATFNGKNTQPEIYRRGYFMGRDITAELTRAGLPSLPDLNFDIKKLGRVKGVKAMQIDQWQGYANYAWVERLRANASADIEVHYRALPAFALANIDSDEFSQAVLQHCGDPHKARSRVRAIAGATSEAILEKYEVPLLYLRMQDIHVRIVSPRTNWLHARPIISLGCGLANAKQLADIDGEIYNANASVSILVVSVPEKLASARNADMEDVHLRLSSIEAKK